jgi:hypothetical protein
MIIWDTTKQFYYWPKNIRISYVEVYKKNFRRFNLWVDNISTDNKDNIHWWFSRPASRDERISDLFKNICIFFTILKINKYQNDIKIYSDSPALKKLITEKKIKNCNVIIKNKNFVLKQSLKFIKEILLQFFNLTLIKFYKKKKINKNINLIDRFQISKNFKKETYFGNFISKKDNFLIVPSLLSYKPKNILFFVNKKNFFLKETFLNYSDIIFIGFSLIFKRIKLNQKYLKFNFNNLIKEEFKFDNNLRSIIFSYINYFFFKNLVKKNFQIKKVYSWYENQIIDKGWSLGVNKYFSKAQYIGYQGSTLHPQFFNLSTTKQEFLSGVVPKNIILIGKQYLKNRKIFSNKINYTFTAKNRFLFKKENKNKIYISFLLSGIEKVDEIMLKIFTNFSNKKVKNLKIKFHPILPSKNFLEKINNETKLNASNLIGASKIIVTSSYTSALYESLANDTNTIMIDFSPFDRDLFKKLKPFSKKIHFCRDFEEITSTIDKINNKKKINYKEKKRFKKLFFSK